MTTAVIPAKAGIQGSRVAVLGAPGTGKTQLAAELTAWLRSQGLHGITIQDDPPYPAGTTLLMGLDLPGDVTREVEDAQLRSRLQHAGIAFHVVYGTGPQRLQSALFAMQTAGVLPAGMVQREEPRQRAWVASCEKCSDPDCEHRLFTQLREQRS